jgi:distribution and morphology protein 12
LERWQAQDVLHVIASQLTSRQLRLDLFHLLQVAETIKLSAINAALIAHVMSIELDWEAATSGPDGEKLAETIRSFVHDKFQQVPLPRFIRSVQVQTFEFGKIAPELEIKDLCDPFTDFYEEDEDDDVSDTSEKISIEPRNQWHAADDHSLQDDINQYPRIPHGRDFHASALRSPIGLGDHLNSQFRSGTPGIPGGTSNIGYHLMLGGLSGAQTPLAAVAGGSSFATGWPDTVSDTRVWQGSQKTPQSDDTIRRWETEVDNSSPSRPSTANTNPSRLSQGPSAASSSNNTSNDPTVGFNEQATSSLPSHQETTEAQDIPHAATEHHESPRHMRERRPEDFQVVCRVKYAGDVKLSLTAEILLDYPMPSFVGLPLKLNITGVTFDGVAVIAYIRRRAHLCFLSPEDADALLGPEDDQHARQDDTPHVHSGTDDPDSHLHRTHDDGSLLGTSSSKRRFGSLLQQIRVDSEIGRKENGKQVLKNVGKVERFVLDQVRRILEDEFVFPSFWTFLV